MYAGGGIMATELCQKCKTTHPGRACDYDDKGDCAETDDLTDVVKALNQGLKDKTEPASGK
jgi:hypothetical protein